MVYLNTNIDNHFISLLEYKNPELKFKRVDSYVSESIKESEDNNADNTSAIKSLFEKYAGDAKVDVQALKAKNVTAMFTISEEARRMEEMAKMYGNMGMMNLPKQEETLVVNSSNALVSKLAEREDDSIKELICSQIVAMAKLSRSSLTGDEKTEFLDRSAAILEKLLEK